MEEAFRYAEEKFNVGMVNTIDYNLSKNSLTVFPRWRGFGQRHHFVAIRALFAPVSYKNPKSLFFNPPVR